MPPQLRAESNADYVKGSASLSLLVVRASQLAAARSPDAAMRRLAERLARDHAGIANQLSFAGRRLNLLPPASLSLLDQALLDGLIRASDFDTAYARTMQSAVDRCRSDQARYAALGSSPTFRPVARFAASVCAGERPLVPAR
jgi:putative membrane protein